MSRAKGAPKTGGRQAGTPNKLSGTLKDFVANLLDDNRQQIVDDLKTLRPKERLLVLERMMQYVLPRQQAVSGEMDISNMCNDIKIQHVYSNPDEAIFPSSEEQVDIDRC